MDNKKWIIKAKANSEKVAKLSEVLGIDKNLSNLLVQKGIENYDDARKFFRPQLNDLHNPFLMKDMDNAVNRLQKAIDNNENILIFSDYDVDGTTGVALLYKFLTKFYKKVFYYVPDRYVEGYGVSFKGIDFASENSCSLVITVDCGIKAVKQINYANEKNIDVIVCDHHNQGEILPKAFAILDPKRNDCNYPYKELSGCGVAFKFLQAFCNTNNHDINNIFSLLDLVVVSIGSDIVPITGENRILAYFGLIQLNTNPCLGLKSIINLSGIADKEIQINDIVFKIGPRINAAGRLTTGKTAVELLISENETVAEEIGNEINKLNAERKDLDQKVTEEALSMIDNSEILKNAYTTVVYSENWSKGIVGIVASRLTETYYRPTIVFTKSNNLITGSARSVYGYNLYNAIEHCSDLLENFGGHTYAAGLTLKDGKLNEFTQRFENYVKSTITELQLTPTIDVDMILEIKDITPKFYRILKQFAPFGPENMTPVFVSKNVFDNGQGKIVGQSQEHIKLKIVQQPNDNRCIDAIGFGFAQYYEHIKKYKPFDVCYQIYENNFMNQTCLQMLIKDISIDG